MLTTSTLDALLPDGCTPLRIRLTHEQGIPAATIADLLEERLQESLDALGIEVDACDCEQVHEFGA